MSPDTAAARRLLAIYRRPSAPADLAAIVVYQGGDRVEVFNVLHARQQYPES